MSRRRPGDWTDSEQGLINQLRHNGLTIGVLNHEPWAYACALATPPCSNPGIGIEFTRTLCDRLKISCSFIPLNTTEVESNGDVQKSLTDMILSEQVDTCLPILMETNQYRKMLDFTMPMFFMEGGAMVKTQFSYSSDYFFVLTPFEPIVWIYMALLLCAVGLWDCCCRVALKFPKGIKAWLVGFWRYADHSVLQNLGLLLQRGVNIEAQEMSRRVLLLVWGLASILICGIYSAFIVSHRVAAKVENPFTTISQLSQLVKEDKYKLWIDLSSAGLLNSISSSPTGMFYSLNRSLTINPPSIFLNLSVPVVQSLLSSENLIALYSSLYTLKAIAQSNCNVTVIPLQVLDMGAFAFRKGTNYAQLFTKLILNFKDKGYYLEHLEQKYRFGRSCDSSGSTPPASKDGNQIEVTVWQLQAVFYFVLLGGSIGGLVCFLEQAYHRTVNRPSVRALVARSLNLQMMRAAVSIQPNGAQTAYEAPGAQNRNGYI